MTSGSAHNPALEIESRETLRELDARVVAVLDELNSGAGLVSTHPDAAVRAAVAWRL